MTQPQPAAPRPTDPVASGGKGGLIAALVITILLLIATAFLFAKEKRANQELGDSSTRTTELERQLETAKADAEQAQKDLRKLQTTPSGDADRVTELTKEIEGLKKERDFAETQRADAQDFVIEVQRQLNDFKQTVIEADAKIKRLEEENASLRGGR